MPDAAAGPAADPDAGFPAYTAAERRADAAVHAVGVTAGLAGGVWLVVTAAVDGATAVELAALAVYALGLAGMLGASAAYNLAPPGRGKALLRRIDHAMIFVMIAGSYTPLGVARIDGGGGVLCAAVWAAALAGGAVKLLWPGRFERTGLALYLVLGWAVIAVAEPLARSLSPAALTLLVAGGVAYTAGVVFHVGRRPFFNAAWHVFVLVGAACHFAAMTVEFVP